MSNIDELAFQLKETLSEGKEFIMPVKGTSMLPFIHDSDAVTLVKPTELRKNDIVFYQRKGGQYVLHRIYKIQNGTLTMLGDNQTAKENGMDVSQVIAKVKNIIVSKTKIKELKGFGYHCYLFFWNQLFIRKVILKLRRLRSAK